MAGFFPEHRAGNPLAAAARRRENGNCHQTGSSGSEPLLVALPQFQGIAMSTTLSLVSELERIARALDTEEAGAVQPSLPTIAEKIAKIAGVRNEEVAILAVSTRWKHLHFLVPEALKNVGFIPLTSTWSLAARTVRESRPEIDNSFSATRHPIVFEGIRIKGETPECIQKLISAPILFDGKVIGVIQVSRKGGNISRVGPDFTSDDLGNLLALCKPLGRLVKRAAAE
jgi:hypothetical protein